MSKGAILVVDDESEIREGLELLLTSEGYGVSSAETGESGLGLSVSYGIIKEHAGKVDVRSAPGKGTSFHVELPAVRKPVHV